MMDQDDIKACGTVDCASYFPPPEQPDLVGKSLSDFRVGSSDENTGLEKQRHGSVSNHEINSSVSAKFPELERKCLDHVEISSIGCTEDNTDESRLLSSVASPSRNSEVDNENCAGGTLSTVPHRSRHASSGGPNDCGVSAYSPGGNDSTPNICLKSPIRQPHSKESNDYLDGRINEYWLDAGEDGLKSGMMTTCDNKQLKTESSSSNSTRTILPASSTDSCPEMLVDFKSCENNKRSASGTSRCTDFKCSLEKTADKSSVLPVAAQIVPKEGIHATGFSPEKLGQVCKLSENVGNLGKGDCNELQGMIADSNPLAVETCDIQKSNLPKKGEPHKVKPCCEPNDALEVVQIVAREVEQETGRHKEASGSCSSVQERSVETFRLSCVDFAVSARESLTETGSEIHFSNEQDKCDSFCSPKNKVDPEMSIRNEELCLAVKEPPQNTTKMHEDNYCLPGQKLPPLTTKTEDTTANDWPTCVSRFDLNENVLANEADCPKGSIEETLSSHAEILSKPIPVVAKSGISICFPKPHLQLNGEVGGWRGSVATSAFRPTFLPESLNRIKASVATNTSDGSKSSQEQDNGIDLNIAAEGGDGDAKVVPEMCNTPMPCYPSKDSSLGISLTRAEMLNIDLNCVGENNDNCQLSPASSSRCSVRDFDLNDNPNFVDACSDASQQGEGSLAIGDGTFDNSVVTYLGKARQPESNGVGSSFWEDSSHVQSFNHSHAKPSRMAPAPPVLPPVEQMHNIPSLQQRSIYTALPPPPALPPHAFPYNNAFFIDSDNRLFSTAYPPSVIQCITDPQVTPVYPQMLGSSAHPAFSGSQHLMQVHGGSGPSNIAMIRPTFDTNGGVISSEGRNRGENGTQWFIPVNNAASEDRMRYLHQFALPAPPMKRREPDAGWDSHQHGFKQMILPR